MLVNQSDTAWTSAKHVKTKNLYELQLPEIEDQGKAVTLLCNKKIR